MGWDGMGWDGMGWGKMKGGYIGIRSEGWSGMGYGMYGLVAHLLPYSCRFLRGGLSLGALFLLELFLGWDLFFGWKSEGKGKLK